LTFESHANRAAIVSYRLVEDSDGSWRLELCSGNVERAGAYGICTYDDLLVSFGAELPVLRVEPGPPHAIALAKGQCRELRTCAGEAVAVSVVAEDSFGNQLSRSTADIGAQLMLRHCSSITCAPVASSSYSRLEWKPEKCGRYVLASDTLTVDEAMLTVDVTPADLQTLELVRKKSNQSVPEICSGEDVELATFSAHDRFGNSLGSNDVTAIEVELKRNDTAGDVVSVGLQCKPDGWLLRWLPTQCGRYVLQPDAMVKDRHGAGLRSLRFLGQDLTVDVRPGPLFMLQAIDPTKVEAAHSQYPTDVLPETAPATLVSRAHRCFVQGIHAIQQPSMTPVPFSTAAHRWLDVSAACRMVHECLFRVLARIPSSSRVPLQYL
jgi:hypothetical protein